MADDTRHLQDEKFQELLARRSRLRWTLTGIVVFAYLAFGIGGIYARDALGQPFMGGSMPLGLVLGYAIIALAIGLSLYYVRRVNQLVASSKSAGSEAD